MCSNSPFSAPLLSCHNLTFSYHLPALACLLTSSRMQSEHIISYSFNLQSIHISTHSIMMGVPRLSTCICLLCIATQPLPHYWALCQCLYHITDTLCSASVVWLYTFASSSLCWQSVFHTKLLLICLIIPCLRLHA
jgi:hypothetical protein